MYLWMYNQETGHFPHFSRHLYRNLLVHLSVGVVFGPHGPPPPFFPFVEIPASLRFRAQRSTARLFFPSDIHSPGSSFLPTCSPNLGLPTTAARRYPNGRSGGQEGLSLAPKMPPALLCIDRRRGRLAVSRLPLPVSRLASCIMLAAATFADEDQEGSPKAGQHLSDHQAMSKFIDQALPHWADYRRHSVGRPPPLRVSSHPPIHHTQRSNRQPPLLAQGEVRKEHSSNPRSRPYCCASDTVQRTGKPAASIAARLSRLDGLTLCDRHFCPVCPLARLLCTGPRLSTARVA